VQKRAPWGTNLLPKFYILTVLGAVFPHFCPDKREIWHGGADRPFAPRAKFHVYRGNVSPLRGEKPIFGLLIKNNTGMAPLHAGLSVIKLRLSKYTSIVSFYSLIKYYKIILNRLWVSSKRSYEVLLAHPVYTLSTSVVFHRQTMSKFGAWRTFWGLFPIWILWVCPYPQPRTVPVLWQCCYWNWTSNVKIKVTGIYIAPIVKLLRRSGTDHALLPANYTMPGFTS